MVAAKSRSTVYTSRDTMELRAVLVLYSATRCLKTTENKIRRKHDVELLKSTLFWGVGMVLMWAATHRN